MGVQAVQAQEGTGPLEGNEAVEDNTPQGTVPDEEIPDEQIPDVDVPSVEAPGEETGGEEGSSEAGQGEIETEEGTSQGRLLMRKGLQQRSRMKQIHLICKRLLKDCIALTLGMEQEQQAIPKLQSRMYIQQKQVTDLLILHKSQ